MRFSASTTRRHLLGGGRLSLALRQAAALLVVVGAACTDPPLLPPGDPVVIDRDAGTEDNSCEDDFDCPFGEECVDGECTEIQSVSGDTGCTSDADCDDGFSCALTTGQCIPDADVPPPVTGPPGPCVDGETRTCGEKIGECEYGVERCVDDVWSGLCEGGRGPVAETCNGLDDDCDAATDEDFDLFAVCEEGLGVCRRSGVTVCTANGASVECSADPPDPTGLVELCGNATDDDCDGVLDDELEFPTLGDSCSAGRGACLRSGSLVCAGDGSGPVCDAVPGTPSVELCGNDIDDDCNGTPDDGFEALNSACTIAGVCPVPGTLLCAADRLDLECVADAPIGPEAVCNGIDDDDDTCPDDGFALGATCAVGVGACRRTGTTICNATQDGVTCDATAGTGSAELCGNTIDEDCDGQLNNGFALGAPCTEGIGACARSGSLQCSADGTRAVCSVTAGAPSAERCGNNIDEDCSGAIDNGFDIGAACSAGQGICLRDGQKICNTANTLTTVCDAVAGNPNPLGELCDNDLDDNCNGTPDEGFADLGLSCALGTGECRRTGNFVCSADLTTTVCNAVPGTAVQELCDDRDNDCNTVIDNGCDDDDDNFCDDALGFNPIGPTVDVCPSSSANRLDCADTNANIHPDAAETCRIDAIDMNCDGDPNDGCPDCDPNRDNDFDGSNECNDCDDTNGAVRPGATEQCNGFDDDCDTQIDEGFDGDNDGFTSCGTAPGGGVDPARIDCNNGNNTIFPGACELCANAAGTVACGAANDRGNNVDEDCDGFRDETCAPCTTTDVDGDGASQCDGDCNDSDPAVRPGRAEVCDGKDTDCNRNTVDNCGVGEQCDDIQGTDTFDQTADVCRDNLICVAPVQGSGQPFCTSFCNFSFEGLGLGDGCAAGEACNTGLTPTENLHGCRPAEGTRLLGQACNNGNPCAQGVCAGNVCRDFCGSDAYCSGGTVCQALSSDTALCITPSATQTRDTGVACSGNAGACMHGSRTCINMNGTLRCSEPCCTNSDCPTDFYCSLNAPESASPAGGVDSVPMCFPETSGNQGRQAGAACSANTECASEFCDVNLGVCIDICCNDNTCPVGLQCEHAIVERPTGNQTFGRFCLNSTPAAPLEKR